MDIDAGAALPLLSGILWVALFLVGILIGVWLLVFYWQYEILRSLKDIPSGLDSIQTEVKRILQAIQSYSPDDPQPYGSLTAEIIRQVDKIANRLAALNNQYADIQNQLYKLSPGTWQLIISAPFTFLTWFRLQRSTASIWREITELQSVSAAAWAQVKDLENQAWRLALRVRAVIGKKKDVNQLIDFLSDQKLYGDTFDQILEKDDLISEALDHIPQYFLLADESALAEQTSKSDVWQVHSVLSETEPVLEEIQDKLILWKGKYKNLAEKASHYSDQLARIEQLISAAPEGMILEPEKKQLVVLGDTLKVLSDTLTRLEVDSIEPVERELDQIRRASNDIASKLRQGYRDYPKLKKILVELLSLQRQSADLFGNLVTTPIYPIVWDRSQKRFIELNKLVNELGGPEKVRSLEEINQHWIAAQDLFTHLTALHVSFQQITTLHGDLIGLYQSDEIQQALQRFPKYYQLADQIAQYNPDNWASSDSASHYQGDVQNLEVLHKSFLARDPEHALPESEFNFWVQKADELVEKHKQLQLRSERIQVRLQYLKVSESSAKEAYEAVQKALTQITWLVNSNVMLKKLAERDIKRLSLQSGQCAEQLGSPQSGLVENKLRMVQSLKDEVEDAGHGWLEQLNRDIDERRTLLAEKVQMLSKIANLDDPTIDKVKRLLAGETRSQVQDERLPSFQLSMGEMIFDLKGRSLVWQELVAAQKELEEIVETPLLDAFKHAETQRKLAIDAITKAAKIIPEQHSWPPCTVSIAAEKMELARLESTRSALVNKQARAIWAVRGYGDLAASYQSLAGKIDRSCEWALHEQNRITDLESQIDRLIQGWQKQEQQYSADTEIVEQIRRLRAQANLTLEKQKQSWILPGLDTQDAANYEEVLQNLVEIARVLRSFKVKMQDDIDMPDNSILNNPQPHGDVQDEKI